MEFPTDTEPNTFLNGHTLGWLLLAFCTVQGVIGLALLWRSRQAHRRLRADVDGLQQNVRQFEAQRGLAQLETRLLNDLANASTPPLVLEVLLQHLLPDPQQGCAAYFTLRDDKSQLAAMRGIDAAAKGLLKLEPAWRLRLTNAAAVRVEAPLVRSSEFFANLPHEDREKVGGLFVIRAGTVDQPDGVLVTSTLGESEAPVSDLLELTHRVSSAAARHSERTQRIQLQADELRITREILELRSLVDSHFNSPMELLEEFLCRLIAASGFDRGVLYLTDDQGQLAARPVVVTGTSLPRGLVDLWQMDEFQIVQRTSAAKSLLAFSPDDLKGIGARSTISTALSASLMHDNALIGVVCMTRRSDDPVTVADQELVRWSSEYLAETIMRSVNRVIVEQQARRDALTDLANRRTFDHELRRHVEQTVAGGDECSLIMLDLDRFKSLNDRYGHPAGDEVLRTAARVITRAVSRTRVADRPLVARYGGEEIAVILPGMGIDGAERVAYDIVRSVRETTVSCEGVEIFVTISGGVASCPLHGNTPMELISAADAALYRAKQFGRDRFEIADTAESTVESTVATL